MKKVIIYNFFNRCLKAGRVTHQKILFDIAQMTGCNTRGHHAMGSLFVTPFIGTATIASGKPALDHENTEVGKQGFVIDARDGALAARGGHCHLTLRRRTVHPYHTSPPDKTIRNKNVLKKLEETNRKNFFKIHQILVNLKKVFPVSKYSVTLSVNKIKK